MIGRRVSERDRRALAIGALVLAPAVAWYAAVAPYVRAARTTQDRLATERRLLERELSLLASAATYPETLRDGASRLIGVMPRLFEAPDGDGTVGAEVTGHVGRHARRSRVLVARIDPMPPRAVDAGVVSLPVRVGGEGDLEGLLTLLRSLRTGRKLIHVTALRIDAPEARRRAGGPEALTFEFTATGFALARAEREPDVAPGAAAGSGP